MNSAMRKITNWFKCIPTCVSVLPFVHFIIALYLFTFAIPHPFYALSKVLLEFVVNCNTKWEFKSIYALWYVVYRKSKWYICYENSLKLAFRCANKKLSIDLSTGKNVKLYSKSTVYKRNNIHLLDMCLDAYLFSLHWRWFHLELHLNKYGCYIREDFQHINSPES